MPLAEIQVNHQEESWTNSTRMAAVDIELSSEQLGANRGKSTSLPQSRCNSWRGRHHSGNNTSSSKHSNNSKNSNGNTRRRSSARLTRTNSASMPDCSSNSIAPSGTSLGLWGSYGGGSYNNCPVCMVRSFKTTSKGDVVSTGSFSKAPSANSLRSSGSLNTSSSLGPLGDAASRRCSEDRESSSSGEAPSVRMLAQDIPNICVTPSYFTTLVLGSAGVGKTSLVRHFTRADDPHCNEEEDSWRPGSAHVVSVELDGSESTMEFIDASHVDLDLENYQVDAYILMYSVSDPASFGHVVSLLLYLRLDLGSDRPVYLVANKTDLARQSRVAASEACRVASSHDCHFLETSTALNVNVDELLVGVLCSIQRQLTPPSDDTWGHRADDSPRHGRKSSRGRRASAGRDRRGSSSSNNSGGGAAGKRKSLGLLGEEGSLAVQPAAFSCLTSGFPAFSSRRDYRSSSFSECSHNSKSSNSAFSAISNFIKQACRRESKRRDAHA